MKLLFLVSRVPYPLEKGDKLRAYHQLAEVSKRHEVHLCALNDTQIHPDAIKALSSFAKQVYIIPLSKLGIAVNILRSLMNGKPMQIGYFFNKKGLKTINDLIEKIQPHHIYCQLSRVAEYVRHIPGIPKTLDYQDAFSKGIERRIANSPFYWKPILRMEHRRLLKYENEIFDDFQNKTIISEQDREQINHPEKGKIIVVPNGVDMEFFQPIAGEKKYEIVFTGNMAYPPNINGAEYLVNKILPLVEQKIPKTKVLLAGAFPVAKVRQLACDNVNVTGWVEDIRSCYAQGKIFVAPMQIGTGLQNKLLEAMAMKIPCITSCLANNALKATHDKNIIVCEKPEEYAEQIIRLLKIPEDANRIAQNGYEMVVNRFSWKAMTQPLLDAIKNSTGVPKNIL